MQTNNIFKTPMVIAILLASFSIAYYFMIFSPNYNQSKDMVSNTLKCNELYELKKSKYWNTEIGQSKAIYNTDLNTCLALNIYNNFDTKKYFATVIDMSDDSTLMYYNFTPEGFYFEDDKKITCEYGYDFFEFVQNGKKIKEYGCEEFGLFDDMFEKVRSYGFKVFDGFSTE